MINAETQSSKDAAGVEIPGYYIRVTMEGHGTYVTPVAEIGNLIDEINDAASCATVGTVWKLELITMTLEEFGKLPEFTGF